MKRCFHLVFDYLVADFDLRSVNNLYPNYDALVFYLDEMQKRQYRLKRKLIRFIIEKSNDR
jgi:hypothetical protein